MLVKKTKKKQEICSMSFFEQQELSTCRVDVVIPSSCANTLQ